MKIFAFLATLATLFVGIPHVNFTEDSAYTKQDVLTMSIREEYDGTTTAVFSEKALFGYKIYDDPNTPYVDGIILDGEPLSSTYTRIHYDTNAEHTLTVKTVYQDNFTGALAMAMDGDNSKILENPIVYMQIVYYILNTIALFVNAVVLIWRKKKSQKAEDKIVDTVDDELVRVNQYVEKVVENIVSEVFKQQKGQYEDIIKAIVLSRSNKNEDAVALLDLLNKSSSEDISQLTNRIKKALSNEIVKEQAKKVKAIQKIKEASKVAETVSTKDDGTSI